MSHYVRLRTDDLQLTIEKLVYGGDGLARTPPDEGGRGKTVFLPFVLPGEEVEATLVESRPGFARARLEQVLTPSADRIAPDCPYFGECGGCHYQHISYEAQLRHKTEILRETLRRTAKLELQPDIQVHSAEPWHYRNRSRLQVRHADGFKIGYFRYNSHDVLAVEACPISSPLINQAIAAMWQLGRAGEVSQSLHGVQFFANHDDTQLLVEGYVSPDSTVEECQRFAKALHSALPQVAGVVCFVAGAMADEARAPLTSARPKSIYAVGAESIDYHAVGYDYRVSAGSFFQTNRFLIDTLVQTVTAGRKGRAALDLYAGVGLFAQSLARNFDQVLAVEAAPQSFADLRHNSPENVNCVRTTTEAFLAGRAAKLAPDFVVVDPPRAGLGEKAAGALGRMSVPYVTYVSCDPATLARDLRVLLESGFRVEQAHLVDLFPQTFHLETVLQLAR